MQNLNLNLLLNKMFFLQKWGSRNTNIFKEWAYFHIKSIVIRLIEIKLFEVFLANQAGLDDFFFVSWFQLVTDHAPMF